MLGKSKHEGGITEEKIRKVHIISWKEYRKEKGKKPRRIKGQGGKEKSQSRKRIRFVVNLMGTFNACPGSARQWYKTVTTNPIIQGERCKGGGRGGR